MNSILWSRFTQLKKNPKMFLTMLLLPLIFSFAFGLSGVDNVKIKIAAVNEDHSEFSRHLIEDLNSTHLYDVIELEEEKAIREVSEGLYEIGMIIPENFSKQLVNGEEPVIQLVDANHGSVLISFESVLMGLLQNMQYNVRIVDVSLQAFDRMGLDDDKKDTESRLYQLADEKWKQILPINIKTAEAADSKKFIYDHKLQMLLGFTLFFSIYTITFSLSEILNDRKNGVWDRLIISPLGKFHMYMGNFIYSFTVGFIQIALLILIGKYLMGVDWGENLLIIFVIVALYIFAIMSLGMLLISLTKTPQQLNAIVPIIAVSSAMLGGAYWPLEIVSSKILLTMANFDPVMYAMEAIKDVVLYQKGWEAIWLPGSVLFLMGIFFMGIGMHLIEKKTLY